MKNCLSILLLAVCWVNAQTSIDFQNPENVAPISAYRLPDWSCSTLHVSGSGSIDGMKNSTGAGSLASTRQNNAGLAASGLYSFFRENEKQLLSVSARLYPQLQYTSVIKNYKFERPSQFDSDLKVASLQFGMSWQRYVRNRHFFEIELTTNLRTMRKNATEEQPGLIYKTDKSISDDMLADVKLGYGFGRIRNVTPVIRALRLRERLHALDYGIVLDDQDIEKMAQHLAKFSGYAAVYDRADKYFWRDFAAIAHIDQIAPYEQFFLQDALSENIGQRYQGWTLSFGAFYTDDRSKTSNETNRRARTSPDEEYNFWLVSHVINDDERWWGPFMSAQWVKNLSLRRQLGFYADAQWNMLLREQFSREQVVDDQRETFSDCSEPPNRLVFAGGIDYLWVLHDRLLWTNNLGFELERRDYNADGFTPWDGSLIEPTDTGFSRRYSLDSKFSYYLENNLELSTTFVVSRWNSQSTALSCDVAGNPYLYSSRKDGAWSWEYQVGLTYYLDRKMF